MGRIFIGFVFIMFGIWGVVTHWYQFLDLLWIVIPMFLIFSGIMTILSGIGDFGK